MTDYRLTGYRPDHRRAVTHLQRLLWGGGTRGNAAYLDWKYHQNPYLDHRYLVLAWAGDELVGMIGAFGACWEMPGLDRTMLPCLADTVVAPEHRGGPLFNRMLDELIARLHADGVPWLLDFGDQPAAPAMLMRGWQAIGPWAVAIAGREEPDAERRRWRGTGRTRLQGSRSGAAMRPFQTARPSALAAMAAFVAQLQPGTGVRHVRDAQYFTWRSRNPLARYFYLAAGPREPDGYLVAHRSRTDAEEGPTPTTIVECEAARDDVWMDLLEAALSRLPGTVAIMWARDISPARLAGLGALGFRLDEPTGRLTRDAHLPNLLVRSTGALAGSSPLAALASPSAWDLRAVCGRSWR